MTNSIVVKNIDSLDRFAGSLERARNDLEAVSRSLQSAVSQVQGDWQDPQETKCEAEIIELQRRIRAFAASAQAQVSYCKRLAAHLRNAPR
jgi:NAD-dependent SIR2 family protein deacetylase